MKKAIIGYSIITLSILAIVIAPIVIFGLKKLLIFTVILVALICIIELGRVLIQKGCSEEV